MLITIGLRGVVEHTKIRAVMPAENPAAQQLQKGALELGGIIDCAKGRKPKSLLLLKSNHVLLSNIAFDVLSKEIRLAVQAEME